MSSPWLWGHKYGRGLCPYCRAERALDCRGRLQRHTHWVSYSAKTPQHLMQCGGSYKKPIGQEPTPDEES